MNTNSLKVSSAEKYLSSFNTDQSSRLSFFLGGYSGTNLGNSDSTDISFISTIPKDDVSLVVRRIDWIPNKIYIPYDDEGNSTDDNFYAYNKSNNIVYLCISNNQNNRKDYDPDMSISKIAPTHKKGIVSYEDGYRWAVLYKIDLPVQKFITSKFLPVPDAVSDFSKNSTSTGIDALATQLCGSSAGNTGSCCIYTNERTYDAGSKTYINTNQLDFCLCETSCWKCSNIADRLKTEFSFNKGLSCSSCLQLISPLSGPKKVLAENPNPLSNDYIQSNNIIEFGRGEILSATIDLSSLTIMDRVVPTPNPAVTVDGDGRNYKTNLITEYDEEYGNVVVGIRTSGPTSRYSNITNVYVDGKDSIFSDKLHFTFDEIDGYAANVRSILGATTLEYYLNIRDADISSKVDQTRFTTYGIAKNILDTDGNKFGADKNISQKHFDTCLTKLNLTKLDSSEIESSEYPRLGQKLSSTNSSNTKKQVGDIVSFVASTDKLSSTAEISSRYHKDIPTNGNLQMTTIDDKTISYKINSTTRSSINTNTGKKILKNAFSYDIPDTVVNNGKSLIIRVFQPF